MKFARVFIFAVITTMIAAVFSWSQAQAAPQLTLRVQSQKPRPAKPAARWACKTPERGDKGAACIPVRSGVEAPYYRVVKQATAWVFTVTAPGQDPVYSAFSTRAFCFEVGQWATFAAIQSDARASAERRPISLSKISGCRPMTAAAVLNLARS